MRIELRLFATLRRYLPPGSEKGKVLLDLQEGLTVEGLIERLGIPPGLAELTVVNGQTLQQDFKEVLRDGDIVSIDLGCTHRGFVADSARTVIVGNATPERARLVETTRGALEAGIGQLRAGNRLGQVSATIQEYIESRGFGVVRKYVGHGVGRAMHEDPQVPNFGPPDTGPVLKKGMVLALEPMVTAGDWETKELDDHWTVVTADGSMAAHFEHTVAVTENGPVVLTVS